MAELSIDQRKALALAAARAALQAQQESERGSIMDPIMQGATLGTADEIGAGIQSLGALFTDETVSEAYDNALNRWRGDLDAYRDRNPGTALVAEIGGALIPSLVTLGSGAPATVGSAMRAGAVAGGAYGFGSGRGGFQERAKDAAWGAATGAAGGAAGHGLAKAGGAALRKLTQGKRAGGARMVEKALQNDDMTVDQVSARLSRAEQAGAPMMVADVGADNVRGVAQALGNTPGKARRILNRELSTRNSKQAARINDAFEEALGSLDDGLKNLEIVLADRARMASPLYKEAYATPFKMTEKLAKVFEKPAAQRARARAINMAKDAGLDPENPVVLIDYTKRSIDDAIGVAKRQGQNERVRSLVKIKSELVNPLKRANPAYRQALEGYASDSAMIDAFEMGGKYLRGKQGSGAINQAMKEMTEGEREFFRSGMLLEIRNVIETAPDAADTVKRVFGSEAKRKILREAFPSKQAYDKFRAGMMRELEMRRTRDAVQVGSRTAPLQADISETTADAAFEGATGNWGSVLRSIKDFLFKRDADPEVAKIAAEILTEKTEKGFEKAMAPGSAFKAVPKPTGAASGVGAERLQNRARRPLELTVRPSDGAAR